LRASVAGGAQLACVYCRRLHSLPPCSAGIDDDIVMTYSNIIHTSNIRTCTYTRPHSYIHAHTCAYMRVHVYTCTYVCNTHMHTHIHTYIRTYVHTGTHTYTHAYIHTYIKPCVHTYINTTCVSRITYIPAYIIRIMLHT